MNKDIYSDRINKLISQMTIEEKVSQLTNSAAAISRLGINMTGGMRRFMVLLELELQQFSHKQ